MKLRHYSFAITLIVTTLFSSCKQNLRMQGNSEEKELPTATIDYNSNTEILFKVVKTGNKELLQELLLTNVDINTKDDYGWMPLHWATVNRHTEVAKLLIKGGAKLDAIDNEGKTPLHRADEGGHTEVSELLKQADTEVKGNEEIINLLKQAGIDVKDIDAKDKYGWTPLHRAAWKGHVDISELLIKAGADVNVKDNEDCTPLHWAAQAGQKELAELLIENGADVNARDNFGRTPLKVAKNQNNESMVKLLASYGGKEGILWW